MLRYRIMMSLVKILTLTCILMLCGLYLLQDHGADLLIKYETDRVSRVAADIRKAVGPEAKFIPTYLIHWPGWNAFAFLEGKSRRPATAVTMEAAFDTDDDELAVIIGHEFAHVILGHLDKHAVVHLFPGHGTSKHHEKMADYLGFYLAQAAGYDACKGSIGIWKRMGKRAGDYIHSRSHPSASQRVHYFAKRCQND